MTQPPPAKYKCPRCGYTKIIRFRSDCFDISDILSQFCIKCDIQMDEIDMNAIDKILESFRNTGIRKL